jgi:Flp pilus assembly protein TadB
VLTILLILTITVLAFGLSVALTRWDRKRAWKRRQRLVVAQLQREWIEADREAAEAVYRHATGRDNGGGGKAA